MKRLLRILSNPLTVFLILPWLMILLIAGTVAQKYMSLEEACKTFFSSFVLWLGPFPLPGGYSVIGFLSLCLSAKLLFASTWHWKRSGILLAHFGVLVLLFGALLTHAFSQESLLILDEKKSASIIATERDQRFRMFPFVVHLNKVERRNYSGTDKASSYTSELTIQDGDVLWPAVITMNKPLHYKGYTFYQSSYIEQGGIKATVLTIVKNKGKFFPYLALSLITAGLALHAFLHLSKSYKNKLK